MCSRVEYSQSHSSESLGQKKKSCLELVKSTISDVFCNNNRICISSSSKILLLTTVKGQIRKIYSTTLIYKRWRLFYILSTVIMVRKSVKSGSLIWCFTCFTLHNFYYGVLPAFHSTSVLSSLMSKIFMCAHGSKNVSLCVCSLTCYLSLAII